MESAWSARSEDEYRANRFELVSRLADDLAHEVKNPLNAIVINLEVLKVRVRGADADGALDRIAVIEQETRRLNALVDRLLLLLRPARAEASSLAVDQALDEILPLFAAQVRLARNEFRSDDVAPVSVPVRDDVFKFAMLNLLNAVHERLGEGGGGIALACEADEQSVRLRVSAEPTGRLQDADAAWDRALRLAGELLEPSGGRVESSARSATAVLPRGAAA